MVAARHAHKQARVADDIVSKGCVVVGNSPFSMRPFSADTLSCTACVHHISLSVDSNPGAPSVCGLAHTIHRGADVGNFPWVHRAGVALTPALGNPVRLPVLASHAPVRLALGHGRRPHLPRFSAMPISGRGPTTTACLL